MVLVAGSSPVGHEPVNAVSSRTVISPPDTGVPASLAPLRAVALSPPPPLQAASTMAAATRGASFKVRLTWVLPVGLGVG